MNWALVDRAVHDVLARGVLLQNPMHPLLGEGLPVPLLDVEKLHTFGPRVPAQVRTSRDTLTCNIIPNTLCDIVLPQPELQEHHHLLRER